MEYCSMYNYRESQKIEEHGKGAFGESKWSFIPLCSPSVLLYVWLSVNRSQGKSFPNSLYLKLIGVQCTILNGNISSSLPLKPFSVVCTYYMYHAKPVPKNPTSPPFFYLKNMIGTVRLSVTFSERGFFLCLICILRLAWYSYVVKGKISDHYSPVSLPFF